MNCRTDTVLVLRERGMETSCTECSKILSRFTQLPTRNLQKVMFYSRLSLMNDAIQTPTMHPYPHHGCDLLQVSSLERLDA